MWMGDEEEKPSTRSQTFRRVARGIVWSFSVTYPEKLLELWNYYMRILMNEREHPLMQQNTSLRLVLQDEVWKLKHFLGLAPVTSDRLLAASDPENKLLKSLGQCQPKLELPRVSSGWLRVASKRTHCLASRKALSSPACFCRWTIRFF